MKRSYIKSHFRPIFHKEDNPAHMTREDRREKDAAVAARHRADGGTRCWIMREHVHMFLKTELSTTSCGVVCG